MWRRGDPVNPVLEGYLWVDRVLVFVLAPILALAVIGAVASRRWIVIPVVIAFALMLYGLRRFALWVQANSAKHNSRS